MMKKEFIPPVLQFIEFDPSIDIITTSEDPSILPTPTPQPNSGNTLFDDDLDGGVIPKSGNP